MLDTRCRARAGARCRETADRHETFHAARAGSGFMSPDAAALFR